jgi:hypothetical protein
MICRDADGQVVAFNMVHESGVEGWMGPLAVRPDRQGEGFGSRMVRLGVDLLKSQGARTSGLGDNAPRRREHRLLFAGRASGRRAVEPGNSIGAPSGGSLSYSRAPVTISNGDRGHLTFVTRITILTPARLHRY